MFCGIQGAGKSTYYWHRFGRTHVHVNLDLLRTRHREERFIRACLDTRMRFVVDNTNPTRDMRARYVEPARDAGFRVVGYVFDVPPRVAIARNMGRSPTEQVPVAGILGTRRILEPPTLEEGFDALFRVVGDPAGGFQVQPMVPALRTGRFARPARQGVTP